MNTQNIPAELVGYPNWVAWKWETRAGKKTKPLFDAKANGKAQYAKSNDPSTWAPFETAIAAVDDTFSDNDYDGVGFVLRGTPFIGVDFDGVIREGKPELFVLDILKRLGNPYTEITPSEKGLRAFVTGVTLPVGKRKFGTGDPNNKYGAEIYSGSEGGRYLTVTGNKFSGNGIPTPENINLAYFMISQITNTKLKALWMGDMAAYENDQSRADLALMVILAREFGGDAEKMEEYFGYSALAQRGKWDRKDYRDRTIKKALELMPETARAVVGSQNGKGQNAIGATTKIISIRACDVVPVPINFLWKPYIQENALNGFYGNPSVGKGITGIDCIARLTTGKTFPTEESTDRKSMNVVVLAAEEGLEDTIVPRLMSAGADLKRVRIIKSIEFHKDGAKLSDRLITFQQDMAALREDLKEHPEEKFLFIDPITNYVGDINFNQDAEVRPVLTLLVQLAEELKITILIVGHFNKNSNVASALDKPGGARAWVSVPRSVWGFFRNPDNEKQRVIANLKTNNARESSTSLIFTIEERIIGKTPKGEPWGMPYVIWGEKTELSANEMVASERPEARRDNKGAEFIEQSLKDGARKATEVYDEADRKKISEATIKRASKTIGVLKFEVPGEGWYWQHPSDKTPIPLAARNRNTEARARRKREEEPADVDEVVAF